MATVGIDSVNHPIGTPIQKFLAFTSIPFYLNIGLGNGDPKMSGGNPGRAVIDSFGEPLTIDTLPPANTVRWVPRLKAQVVCAIREGLICREEACDHYGISNAELITWEKLLKEHGTRALRVTKTQHYRQAATSADEDGPSGTAE